MRREIGTLGDGLLRACPLPEEEKKGLHAWTHIVGSFSLREACVFPVSTKTFETDDWHSRPYMPALTCCPEH